MSGVSVFRRLLWSVILLCLMGRAFGSYGESEPRLPLEQAAQKGDFERTKSLLAEGQSAHVRNSALVFAIRAGHRDIVDLLIANGAVGALWRAAEAGDVKLVEHLLTKEQNQTAYDAALRAAARMGHKQIAELVLARGANVDARLGSEFTPLFFAVAREHDQRAFQDFSSFPLDHFPQRLRKARDRTTLDALLEGLLPAGAINATTQKKPPDPPAIPRDLVELLIEHGADVNAGSGRSGSMTALHYAIYGGDTEVIRLLLDHGAQVNPSLVSGRLPFRYIAPLHLAAYYGELAVCELLIDHGAEVNARAPLEGSHWAHGELQTPLHYSVESGNPKLVEMLINRGADINAADASGRTPLHLATRGKEQSVAEVLLSHGAHVDALDKYRQTPLYWAVERRNASVVQLLLYRGAKPDAENSRGETPLSLAVRQGSNEIVKFLTGESAAATPHVAANLGDVAALARLIEAGVNVNDLDPQGQTVLHAAVRAGQVPAVEWLLAHGADPNRADKDGLTPLLTALRIAQGSSFSNDPNEVARFNALQAKQKRILPLLISRGAEPDFRYGIPLETVRSHAEAMADLLVRAGVDFEFGDSQATLLHRAAWWGKEEVVAALLELGADVNATDRVGGTPLHAATQRGSTRYWDVTSGPHVDVLALLIKHGARVNAANLVNATPLHGAASYGAANAVGLLIRNGADVNASDNTGRTPLHEAADRGAVDVMAMLIQHGADPNATDKEGDTPLLILLRSSMLGREEWNARITNYALELMRAGVRVNALNSKGVTALQEAAALGSPAFLEAMLNRGADVNAASFEGWTALHSAVSSGNAACVEMLLKHGAKADGLGRQSSSFGLSRFQERARTPLQIAAARGYNDIIRLLIAAGADVNARDADTRTALDLAKQNDRPSTVRLLLENGATGGN